MPRLATEGDLKLLAEEQVLEEQAPASAKDAGVVARRNPKSSISRGRIADRPTPAGRAQTFAILQLARAASAATWTMALTLGLTASKR